MPMAFGAGHSASTRGFAVSQTSSVAQDVAIWIAIWNKGWIARYNLTE
jgi:hypothetical protein